MRITIVAVGKIKDSWLRSGIEEYCKRIRPYCRLEIVEVKDLPDTIDLTSRLKQEADNIRAKLPKSAYKILVDLGGKECDSLEFAGLMEKWFTGQSSDLCFIIGGSSGFAPELRQEIDFRLQLSRLTFTHQHTRLILLEQIFRSFKINTNQTYHK